LSWFVMIRMLRPYVSDKAALLVWFYWALIWNPLALLQGSNLVTVAVFSCGVAFCLASVQGRRSRATAVACGICFGTAAALRYAYWPLILVPPLALGFGWLMADRRRRLLESALISGAVAAGLLLLLAGFNKWYLGDIAQYTGSESAGGLHWRQLGKLDYFPARMIGFPYFWGWLSDRLSLARFLSVNAGSWITSAIVMTVATIPLVVGWRNRRSGADAGPGQARLLTFLGAGLATFGLTVAMLGFLSLTVAPIQFASGKLWTYLEQPRYYAPILGFLSVALAAGIVEILEACRKKPWILAPIAMLLLAWLTLGMGFRAKTWIKEVADYENVRTQRQQESQASRDIHAAVRRYIDQGRLPLFLSFAARRPYPPYIPKTPFSVRIAGACTMNPDFLSDPIQGGDSPAVLFVLVPTGAAAGPEETVGGLIGRHRKFEHVATLTQGRVYVTQVE